MATTRLIALHKEKGKTVASSLSSRMKYYHNPLKTERGNLITSYGCIPELADQEFMLSKEVYLQKVGNERHNAIIAYQIRQAFKPGEITAEEANRLGYELALKITGGKHAFTVSTHTDRKHIHNHVIFNSTAMDGLSKFQNTYFSALKLQKISDVICQENGYSVVKKTQRNKNEKQVEYPKRHTKREYICRVIDEILKEQPKSFDDFLFELSKKGYEVKHGKPNGKGEYKHISIKGYGQNRFIRLDSLGHGYTQDDIKQRISPTKSKKLEHENASYHKNLFSKNTPKNLNRELLQHLIEDLKTIIDLEELKKKNPNAGKGLTVWAKRENLKITAETLFVLQELGLNNYRELNELVSEYTQYSEQLQEKLHTKKCELDEKIECRNYVFQYSKTKEYYQKYRTLRGKEKELFYELHRVEIEKHKKSKLYFDSLRGKRTHPIKELNKEIKDLREEVKSLKEHDKEVQEIKHGLYSIKKNLDHVLNSDVTRDINIENTKER